MDGSQFDNLKKWVCDHNKNHVLGILKRTENSKDINGRRVKYHTTQVLLFRQAVDMDQDIPDEIDVAGCVEGALLTHMTWNCTICGTVKAWHPGEEALDWLYRRYGKREKQSGQING